MIDLEFNTKNICLVTPQAIAAGVATADGRVVESKGSRALKIRVLAAGVTAGQAVTFLLKGGNTYATRAGTTVTTVAPVADANGIIDATYYVKVPTTVYQFLTGEATPAAGAGQSVVASVDVEMASLRESSNLTETPELYS